MGWVGREGFSFWRKETHPRSYRQQRAGGWDGCGNNFESSDPCFVRIVRESIADMEPGTAPKARGRREISVSGF